MQRDNLVPRDGCYRSLPLGDWADVSREWVVQAWSEKGPPWAGSTAPVVDKHP